MFNNTLGWLLGFRTPVIIIQSSGNNAPTYCTINGSKYFNLVIDDFNKNHVNNAIVSIMDTPKKIDLPDYYSKNMNHECLNTPVNSSNISLASSSLKDGNEPNKSQKIKIPQKIASEPRTFTQAQLYTINEIVKNRNKTASFFSKSPTTPDTFAIIPIQLNNIQFGDIITDFSSSIQKNKRVYFGPVNIDKLRVRLVDDRGNLVNLNGADWTVAITCENLYQY
jgi:hypothetical protein